MTIAADLEGKLHPSVQTMLAEKRVNIVPKPSDTDRLIRFVTAFAESDDDLAAIDHLIKTGTFGLYADALLAETNDLNHPTIRTRIQKLLQLFRENSVRSPESPWGGALTWPKTHVPDTLPKVDEHTAEVSMGIFGDGPAALAHANLRGKMGFTHTTILGRTKRQDPKRGIWNQDRVVHRGHNTFATVRAFGARLPADGQRSGQEMEKFLDTVALGLHRSGFREGLVTDVRFDRASEQYVVTIQRDGRSEELAFDSICISTGNALPRSLDAPGSPMTTNAHEVRAPMKRWQEPLSDKHKEQFSGRRPIVVGLGNSAMEMIEEFLQMEKDGIPVHPRILTHLSRSAIDNPNSVVTNPSGALEGPLFRHPSDLSKLAGDIPKISDRFFDAKVRGWLMPGVRRWEVHFKNPDRREGMYLLVEREEYGEKLTTRIDDVPMIYALIGYQNDTERLRSWGCKVHDDGTLDFDPVTHRVRTTMNDNGGVYVLGAAASTKHNRNAEVIPGMLRDLGELVFTEIIRANRGQSKKPLTPESIPLDPELPPAVQSAFAELLTNIRDSRNSQGSLPDAIILRNMRMMQKAILRLLLLARNVPEVAGSHIRWMIRRDMESVLKGEKEGYKYNWEEENFLKMLRQRNTIGMVHERPFSDKEISDAAYFRWLKRRDRGEPDDPAKDWQEAQDQLFNQTIDGHMIYELHTSRLRILDFAAANPAVAEALVLKLIGKLSSHRRTYFDEDVDTMHPARYRHVTDALGTVIDARNRKDRTAAWADVDAVINDLPPSRLRSQVQGALATLHHSSTPDADIHFFRDLLKALQSHIHDDLEHEGNTGRIHSEAEIVVTPDEVGRTVAATIDGRFVGSIEFNVLNHRFILEASRITQAHLGVGAELAAEVIKIVRDERQKQTVDESIRTVIRAAQQILAMVFQ